jgi:hypothetical protein
LLKDHLGLGLKEVLVWREVLYEFVTRVTICLNLSKLALNFDQTKKIFKITKFTNLLKCPNRFYLTYQCLDDIFWLKNELLVVPWDMGRNNSSLKTPPKKKKFL